jgi:hypothetical protein
MELSIYCPYCHRYTALSLAKGEDYSGNESGHSRIYIDGQGVYWIGLCNSCNRAVLVNERSNKTFIFPSPLPKAIDERVPDFLKSDLEEAGICLSAGAWRATAGLCRRILQMICLDKGAPTDKDLRDQIGDLASRGIITGDIKEWAHAVRWVGNDALHPNKEVVEKEDAEDIMNLVEQIIHILYIAGDIARKKIEKFRPKV